MYIYVHYYFINNNLAIDNGGLQASETHHGDDNDTDHMGII